MKRVFKAYLKGRFLGIEADCKSRAQKQVRDHFKPKAVPKEVEIIAFDLLEEDYLDKRAAQ